MNEASVPAAASARTTAAKTGGSHGRTPNSRMPRPRDSSTARPRPIASPTAICHDALAEDHQQDAAALGAERHAHADFARAIPGREGHHAVEPDRRHGQGGQSERDEQRAEGAIEPGVERVLIGERSDPVERQGRIEPVHLVLNRGGVAHGGPVGLDDQAHEVDHVLRQRDVDALVPRIEGADRAAEVEVGHDPDDRPPRHVVAAQLDPRAERVAILEEQRDEPLVDDRHRLRVGAVGPLERPAADRLHLDDVEIARRDHDPAGQRVILFGGIGHAVEGDRMHLAAARRQVGGEGDRAHAGPSLEPGHERVVELPLGRRRRVVLLEQAEARGEDVAGGEAVVEARDVDHGADHQAGGHQQAARHGQLGDDQPPGELAHAPARRAARFVVHDRGDVGLGGAQRRDRAGRERRQAGEADDEGDDDRVHRRHQPQRRVQGRPGRR